MNKDKLMKRFKRLKRGFTLIEMLVVVGIIGIVSTILYTNYNQYIVSSRYSAAEAKILEAVNFFETEMADHARLNRRNGPDEYNYITFEELDFVLDNDNYKADLGLFYNQSTGSKSFEEAEMFFVFPQVQYQIDELVLYYNVETKLFDDYTIE